MFLEGKQETGWHSVLKQSEDLNWNGGELTWMICHENDITTIVAK